MPLVQWWCSATGRAWNWSWQGYPGVWAFVILVALLWHRSVGSREGGRRDWRWWMGVAGLVLLWLTLDWPTGPLGAGYLASVHAVQFLMLAMLIPPMLLLALDRDLVARALERRPRLRRFVAATTSPLPVMVAFALVMVLTHIPSVVDPLMRTQVGAFVLDLAWLVSGTFFWWPVVVRVPERPGFAPPLQMLYLFFGTQAHLLIAMWMITAKFPVYATYELAPRVSSVTALEDQQWAAGIMLSVTTPLVLGAIGVLFFRWAAAEER